MAIAHEVHVKALGEWGVAIGQQAGRRLRHRGVAAVEELLEAGLGLRLVVEHLGGIKKEMEKLY